MAEHKLMADSSILIDYFRKTDKSRFEEGFENSICNFLHSPDIFYHCSIKACNRIG
jgi:hypothetical protein